jgi:hypothetical protein
LQGLQPAVLLALLKPVSLEWPSVRGMEAWMTMKTQPDLEELSKGLNHLGKGG